MPRPLDQSCPSLARGLRSTAVCRSVKPWVKRAVRLLCIFGPLEVLTWQCCEERALSFAPGLLSAWTRTWASTGIAQRRQRGGAPGLPPRSRCPASAYFTDADRTRRVGTIWRYSSTGPPAWVADWVQGEVARHPVVLFAETNGVASQAATAALREARVRSEIVDVDRLGLESDGTSWSSLIIDHLMSCSGQPSLPILYVDGRPIGGHEEIERLAASGELQSLCAGAGAVILDADEPATRSAWTPRIGRRWLPPKDISGRRWYQDDPDMAKSPDDYKDPARLEYNIGCLSPGAGADHRGRMTSAGKELLRQETKLDEPDKYGLRPPYRPFGNIDLLLRPDVGWSFILRSRDLKRAKNVRPEDVAREGLSKDQLMWVYSQNKKELVEQLELRQCRDTVLTCIDVQALREALMDEMRKERKFSPTQQGVLPAIIQFLSGSQLREERYADTEVPLLLAVVSEDNPVCFRLRDHLQVAANQLLRAIRIVKVDGHRYPEVAREYGIRRYPTLVWMQGRSGVELARRVGDASTLQITEQTNLLLGRKELPDPEARAALVALGSPATEDRPRWRRTAATLREKILTPTWASTRSLRNSAR